jgi:DNA-binding FrmR family transcriptional regulator
MATSGHMKHDEKADAASSAQATAAVASSVQASMVAEPPAAAADAGHACCATEAARGGASKARSCNCRHKNTERSAAMQADVQKRLNRAIGQLNGVKAMIDDNRYCGDVLVQLAAAESAVRKVSEIVLRDHLETCVVEQVQDGNVEIMDEVMDLVSKFSK